MIGADDLLPCRRLEGITRLFANLGYPVDALPLDPDVWVPRRNGDAQPELFHLCRTAGVDFFAVSGSRPAVDAWSEEFVERHARRNAMLKPVVAVHERGSELLSLLAIGSRGGIRRLDVDLAAPRPEALDRLNALRIVGASAADHRRVVERVFDRESVGRAFFTRFRRSVLRVSGEIGSIRGVTPEDAASEALLIHARLLFLYFVQKKGWLNGEAGYLAARVDAHREDLWHTLFAPLFFGCLNTPRKQRSDHARALGAVPYLNGGLFEQTAFERRYARMDLSDPTLREAVEGVFERYAFSIDEEDRRGIHVDPEMLGRVFESLMESDERAASGSFYTPREIVDVLTRRAIVAWCADGDPRITAVLEAMASGCEAALDPDTAARLLDRLESMTVLDPACGSGAFLLAALHLIERLTVALSAHAGRGVPRDLRRRIVERSLYGVDLKQEAVHLCELRLWLAIVAASRDSIDDVPPLPNLDRNVLQGNSLLSPVDFLSAGRRDIYAAWRSGLREKASLVEAYRHATHAEKPRLYRTLRTLDRRLATGLLRSAIESDQKELAAMRRGRSTLFGDVVEPSRDAVRALERRIDEARVSLRRLTRGTLDYFAYEVHFAHVLASGGFDVILGNPPWVRGANIEPASRRLIAARYPLFGGRGRRGFEQADLSMAFAERALTLLAPGGAMALLLPAKALNAGYASALRDTVARTHEVVAVDDWSDSAKKMFDADTFPLGLTIRKAAPSHSVIVTRDGEPFTISREQLAHGGVWVVDPPDVAATLRRIRSTHPTVQASLQRMPVMGVKSGANGIYFRDDVEISRRRIRLRDLGVALPAAALCRVIRGRDVRRWAASDSTWMIWPPPPRHPAPWADDYARLLEIDRDALALAYVRPEHLGVKVIWKDVSRGMQAAVAGSSVVCDGIEFRLVPNQTVYSVDAADEEEARVIAAIMNSSIFGALAVSVAERAKDRHFRYFAATIAGVPFPRLARGPVWRDLEHLARRGEAGRNVDREVDRAVASLYGCSEKETMLLASYLDARLGRPA